MQGNASDINVISFYLRDAMLAQYLLLKDGCHTPVLYINS